MNAPARIARPADVAPDEGAARRCELAAERRRKQNREAQRRRRQKRRQKREAEKGGLVPKVVAFTPELIAWLVQAGHVDLADLDNPKREPEALGIALEAAIFAGAADEFC